VAGGSLFKYRHSPGFAATEGAALGVWLCAGSTHARSANAIDRRNELIFIVFPV